MKLVKRYHGARKDVSTSTIMIASYLGVYLGMYDVQFVEKYIGLGRTVDCVVVEKKVNQQ